MTRTLPRPPASSALSRGASSASSSDRALAPNESQSSAGTSGGLEASFASVCAAGEPGRTYLGGVPSSSTESGIRSPDNRIQDRLRRLSLAIQALQADL